MSHSVLTFHLLLSTSLLMIFFLGGGGGGGYQFNISLEISFLFFAGSKLKYCWQNSDFNLEFRYFFEVQNLINNGLGHMKKHASGPSHA